MCLKTEEQFRDTYLAQGIRERERERYLYLAQEIRESERDTFYLAQEIP